MTTKQPVFVPPKPTAILLRFKSPLRGFWNPANAKPGPCVSRPDLVAERNEASQITRYEVIPVSGDIGDDTYCVIRRSTGRVAFPEIGFATRDACRDWITRPSGSFAECPPGSLI